MTANPLIFRAYDIRGVADTDLNTETVEGIGKALGTIAVREGATTFAVGRDCRLSGERVRDDLVRGLMSTGLTVYDVGMVPTPMLYFAVHHRDYGGGVQVTGSHNPPEFNGFKSMMGKRTLHGDEILTLLEMIQTGDFVTGEGSLVNAPIEDEYLDYVVDNITMGPRKMRIVVDGGNGVAGPSAMRLFERLGVDAIGRYIEPDGTFPNHHPDPTTVETVAIMREAVMETGADLAIGFDGDGDRIGVVDGSGDVQWGDKLMIIFSRALLAEKPGATIVSEVKCSKTLYDDIAAKGGKGIMWRTGHSPIKAKMKEEGALLGGEMSGHIFFQHRWFGFDDALYAGARLLEILSSSDETLAERLSDVPVTYVTPEIRLECPDEVKFDVVARIVARLKKDHEVFDIDGARVNFPDGWGLIRASNTQPVLVMRAEAQTEARRDEIEAMLRALIREESAT
ncbi:MAG: phosphomannomutase/phosphoglucomutase [Bradymonadia bacterium]|jgi:phosphomannomutase/phosphoglucomutase